MKKLLLIMVMSLLFFGFSATVDTETLSLKLTVPQIYELKISNTNVTTIGGFNSAPKIDEVVFAVDNLVSATYYMLVKTNNHVAVHIDVVLTDLKSTSISTEIAFEFYVDGALLETSTTAGVTKLMYTAPTSTNHGLRVLSIPFYIQLVEGDVWDAIPAIYEASIAFNLVSP